MSIVNANEMIRSEKVDLKKYTINVGLQEDFLSLFSAGPIVRCECTYLLMETQRINSQSQVSLFMVYIIRTQQLKKFKYP